MRIEKNTHQPNRATRTPTHATDRNRSLACTAQGRLNLPGYALGKENDRCAE